MANLSKAESNLAKLSDRRAEMETELAKVTDELAVLEGDSAENILTGADLDKLSGDIGRLTTKGQALTNAIKLAEQREKDANDKIRELRRDDAIKQGKVVVRDALKKINEAQKHVRALEDIGESLHDVEYQLHEFNGTAYTPETPAYFRAEMGMLVRRPQMAIKEIAKQFAIQSRAEKRYREVYPKR